MSKEPEYDVAFSFAGEQREYVETVAQALRGQGIRPFYDNFEQVSLWGKDLYEHLDYVYRRAARYCVIFVSSDYATKQWTTHERKSAQARAFEDNREYILPARFDNTEIPGLRATVGYVDLNAITPEKLAKMIAQKLGPRVRENFFPPLPDLVPRSMGVQEEDEEELVLDLSGDFYRALTRMSQDERRLLFEFFANGCSSDLPENIHISLDLLRRVTSMPVVEIEKILHGMKSLGIEIQRRDEEDGEGDDIAELRWIALRTFEEDWQYEFAENNSTGVAVTVLLGVNQEGCKRCALKAIDNLDFSQLSSALIDTEEHHA